MIFIKCNKAFQDCYIHGTPHFSIIRSQKKFSNLEIIIVKIFFDILIKGGT